MTVTSPVHAALLVFAPGGNSNALIGPLFMYGAIFAIFYFVLIRPQSKQRKDHERMVQNLKRGDEVVTSGGVIGEVVHIKEQVKDGVAQKTMDDRVTIRSGESKLVVERGRIARVTPGAAAAGGGNA
jgi:preprotein translocase subunit YajC